MDLYLTYTPGAYDMSQKLENLSTQVVRFSTETKTATPVFQHNAADVGTIDDGKYILLSLDGVIRTYDLTDGTLLNEKEVPEIQDIYKPYYAGFADGKLLVYGGRILTEEQPSNTSELKQDEEYWDVRYYAIDPESGDVMQLKWFSPGGMTTNYTGDPCRIAAETDSHFLVQTGTYGLVAYSKNLEGKMQEGVRDTYTYGYILKEDFWNNTGEITPVIAATK